MKQRLLLGICAAAVLSMSSAVVAQRLPLDDPNPEWKAELSKKPTPRGADGKPVLVGMWQRGRASFTAEHGPFVEFTRRRDTAAGRNSDTWRGRGDGAVSFINFERDSG